MYREVSVLESNQKVKTQKSIIFFFYPLKPSSTETLKCENTRSSLSFLFPSFDFCTSVQVFVLFVQKSVLYLFIRFVVSSILMYERFYIQIFIFSNRGHSIFLDFDKRVFLNTFQTISISKYFYLFYIFPYIYISIYI